MASNGEKKSLLSSKGAYGGMGDQTMKSSKKPTNEENDNGNGLSTNRINSYGGTGVRRAKTKAKRSLSVGGMPGSPKTARQAAERSGYYLGTEWQMSDGTPVTSESIKAMFSSPMRTFPGRQSIVLAPDDVNLPPQTPLWGSSKLVAQAESEDLKRRGSFANLRRPSCASSISGEGYDIEMEDTNEPALDGSEVDNEYTLLRMGSTVAKAHTLKEIEDEYREKTQTTFLNDAMTFAEGTIPQSIVMATVIGVVCGIVAFLYYSMLDYFLEMIWKKIPEWWIIDVWPEHLYILWIPLVTFTLAICNGLSVYYLGEPGDLAYTIKCVHDKGYKSTSHILPMVMASQFSILAGASLGPEAPLVAICAACAGFMSRKVFKQKNRNVIRKHTFMGMAGALSAFFGVPLGGSLFALEVTSRFGIEYFEHLIEAIFAGEVCVVVFRGIAGLPLGAIWEIVSPSPVIREAQPYMIVQGAIIGLLGAGLAYIWANFHWRLMAAFKRLGLLDDENEKAVPRALLGAVGVAVLGMLVPHTMFWGEFEIGAIATLSANKALPNVWPTSGLINFEMDSWQNCLIVGFCKLMAISFTVAGGFRGGYIFPFFAAGSAFGRAFVFAFPSVSPIIATLCFAAGINVAITRTALATSLILAFLAGEQMALPSILAASVVSLFATGYMPFIKSQIARCDIDFSLYLSRSKQQPMVRSDSHIIMKPEPPLQTVDENRF